MDSPVVEQFENPYPRLLWWEVTNFMSIEHGKCEFDDRNIVNLKGYNDSGKSAMLQALKVLISNSNPTKQVGFIQDDKDYFRVVAAFEDGVMILRDKYINGQSLYEMYKDNQLIYTSKSGNALTRITEVPKPIADYLGLIMYDGTCLNARACFEKQIGVQTTGSENYKMFNTVLKSEEIATASALLNNDRNKLASDINAVDADLQAQKGFLGNKDKITLEMITYLKEHDSSLDNYLAMESALSSLHTLKESKDAVVIYPELSGVDATQLAELDSIARQMSMLKSIKVAPQLNEVDGLQLQALEHIKSVADSLKAVVVPPELKIVNSEQLNALTGILATINAINDCDKAISQYDSSIETLNKELAEMQEELANKGVKMVRCPGCGQIFDPEQAHVH